MKKYIYAAFCTTIKNWNQNPTVYYNLSSSLSAIFSFVFFFAISLDSNLCAINRWYKICILRLENKKIDAPFANWSTMYVKKMETTYFKNGDQ